jgi:selenocysteine-specific elongation factor
MPFVSLEEQGHPAARGAIVAQGGLVRLASHTSSLGATDQRLWERIDAAIGGENRFRPPQVRELSEATGQPVTVVRKLLKTMARLGTVVEVATDRFFLKPALLELGRMAAELAESNAGKTFTAAEFRDRAGSGRNVGIQILEHFDRRGLTLRQGDVRRVVKDPAAVFGDRDER